MYGLDKIRKKMLNTQETRKGYTQAEVAELTGYSVQHLSHIEKRNNKK